MAEGTTARSAPRAPASSSGSRSRTRRVPPQRVLSVDIGGTNVKFLAEGQAEPRRFRSGKKLGPRAMAEGVLAATGDWAFDVVSIGYPGPVVHGRPFHDPANLGPGWVGFDFPAVFGRPVKVINDAAMQALGSYRGGRMLFVGLGTGLGTAMVVDGVVEPMEVAHLPYRRKTFEDYAGKRGLDKRGKKRWRADVAGIVEWLRTALEPDEIVIGGGQAKLLGDLPAGTRLGNNANAFLGGFRLWGDAPGR